MSDPKPTTKRRPSLKIHHPRVRPAPGEACPACEVLYRFCEECHAWGCKCGDPVSVCQSCHQATCGNCGTPYGFVAAAWAGSGSSYFDALVRQSVDRHLEAAGINPATEPEPERVVAASRAKSEQAAPPPLREIAEVLAYADPSGTSSYGPLKVVERWLSGHPEPEPEEVDDPPPVRAIAELAKHAGRVVDHEMTAALEEVEQWLSGFALDEEPGELEDEGEETVGSVEQEVLETLVEGGTEWVADEVIDAISIVARSVDELTKRLDGGAR